MRIKHHISGLYKKILTPIGVRFFFLISFAVVYASSLTTAQWKIITQIFNSGYAIDKNIAATSVYGGSAGAVCKKVTNTCTPGDGIFVPTKYDSEWQGNNGFINKYPSCTVVATCGGCSSNSDCSTNQICTGHVAATTTYNTRGFTGSFVSVGTTNTCALSQGGTVKCWGANSNGELGIGVTGANTNLPSQVVGITTAIQVSVGNVHACVLLAGGTIQCWGYNGNGALGNGSNTSSNISVQVSGITNAIQISAGSSSSCALLNDGTVKCWGYNTYGQLGNGSNTTSSNIPVQVSGITNAIQISAGSLSSCALLNDGTIKCWGDNTYGQLGNGTIISSNIPVQVSNLTGVIQVSAGQDGHTCALLNDGTVKCWGFDWRSIGTQYNNTIKLPVLVSGLTGVIQISAGSPFSCALLTGGISKCWGDNTFGQLGNGNTNSSSVPVQVSTLTGVIQISAGSSSACALLSGSIVKCWGTNQYGELGDGTFAQSKLIPGPVSNLSTPVPSLFSIIPEVPGQCVAVPTGCKVNADCSTNQTCSGYVASQSEITGYPAISQGIVSSEQYKSCILSGGTVRCWGNGLGTTPIKVSNLDNVLGVYSSDYRFSCALKTDGTVWCWGIGNNGELGNGTLSTSSVPVKVSNLSGVSVLAVGSQHSCVLKTDGTVWCWGRNSYGELGIAPSTYSTVPVQNINIANVKSLALGYNHSCALLNNGTVKCWGDNEYGLLGNNSTTNSSLPLQVYNLTGVTSIQSRGYTSCALKTDGTVWCWGNGIYQAPSWFPSATNIKPTLRPNLSNVNTFFLGVNNACAILSDSTVKCWGGNDYGQLGGGNLNGLTDVTTLALGQVNIYALHQNGTLSSFGSSGFSMLGNNVSITAFSPTVIRSAKAEIQGQCIGPSTLCKTDAACPASMFCYAYQPPFTCQPEDNYSNGVVSAVNSMDIDGTIYLAFSVYADNTPNQMWKWNGSGFVSLTPGVDFPSTQYNSNGVTSFSSGTDHYFVFANDITSNQVWKWNGSKFVALTPGVNFPSGYGESSVTSFESKGIHYVLFNDQIWKLNGSSFQKLSWDYKSSGGSSSSDFGLLQGATDVTRFTLGSGDNSVIHFAFARGSTGHIWSQYNLGGNLLDSAYVPEYSASRLGFYPSVSTFKLNNDVYLTFPNPAGFATLWTYQSGSTTNTGIQHPQIMDLPIKNTLILRPFKMNGIQYLASNDSHNTIYAWNGSTFQASDISIPAGGTYDITSFVMDGSTYLVYAGGLPDQTKIWKLDGSIVREVAVPPDCASLSQDNCSQISYCSVSISPEKMGYCKFPDPQCGSATTQTYTTQMPNSNLCATGTSSSVEFNSGASLGLASYSWTCTNNASVQKKCATKRFVNITGTSIESSGYTYTYGYNGSLYQYNDEDAFYYPNANDETNYVHYSDGINGDSASVIGPDVHDLYVYVNDEYQYSAASAVWTDEDGSRHGYSESTDGTIEEWSKDENGNTYDHTEYPDGTQMEYFHDPDSGVTFTTYTDADGAITWELEYPADTTADDTYYDSEPGS